jgi:hypothetical protein
MLPAGGRCCGRLTSEATVVRIRRIPARCVDGCRVQGNEARYNRLSVLTYPNQRWVEYRDSHLFHAYTHNAAGTQMGNKGQSPILVTTLRGRACCRTMPRVPRLVVPGLPHHVTQRGNNHQDVFFVDDDRRAYLKLLAEQSGSPPPMIEYEVLRAMVHDRRIDECRPRCSLSRRIAPGSSARPLARRRSDGCSIARLPYSLSSAPGCTDSRPSGADWWTGTNVCPTVARDQLRGHLRQHGPQPARLAVRWLWQRDLKSAGARWPSGHGYAGRE